MLLCRTQISSFFFFSFVHFHCCNRVSSRFIAKCIFPWIQFHGWWLVVMCSTFMNMNIYLLYSHLFLDKFRLCSHFFSFLRGSLFSCSAFSIPNAQHSMDSNASIQSFAHVAWNMEKLQWHLTPLPETISTSILNLSSHDHILWDFSFTPSNTSRCFAGAKPVFSVKNSFSIDNELMLCTVHNVYFFFLLSIYWTLNKKTNFPFILTTELRIWFGGMWIEWMVRVLSSQSLFKDVYHMYFLDTRLHKMNPYEDG